MSSLLLVRHVAGASSSKRAGRANGYGVAFLRSGYGGWVDSTIEVRSVDRVETRNGHTRFVVRDESGREYTTFRPQIGERAEGLRGGRARIEFHEQRRGEYLNTYLDAIEPEAPAPESAGTDAEEAAWRTAVEAAPWLLGSAQPEEGTEPDELFETLKPFKDLVAEDIRAPSDGNGD
jgi:hypothetical protein